MNYEEIVALFDARPSGSDHAMGKCPGHDDQHGSLSISRGDDGKSLICCQAGCKTADVMAAKGKKMADLFDDPPKTTPTPKKGKTLGPIEKIYDYPDADGALVMQVVRHRNPKDFRQRRPDPQNPGKFLPNLDGIKPPLYRLPQINAAIKAGETVFVVEGEKDADALTALGLPATCNPMGAGKFKPHHANALIGADVVVIVDADPPGRKHGEQVAALLQGRARRVRVVELPGPGKDFSEWITDGSREEFLELVEQAPTWTPPTAATPSGAKVGDSGIDAACINKYLCADSGQSDLFGFMYDGKVRYDHKRKIWLIWRRHWWEEDQVGEIVRLVLHVAELRFKAAWKKADGEERKKIIKWCLESNNRSKIDAVLALARSHPALADAGDGWDGGPLLLGVANGVVDLEEGCLIEGKPEQKISKHVPIAFDPDATWPERWAKFLDEIFAGDNALIAFMQKVVGYILTGLTREQCYFVLWGRGANGKSTFLKVLRALLGPYAINLPFSTFEAGKGPSITTDLAMMKGARLITSSEASESSRFNSERLKALSGEDAITARHLYGREFTFTPTGKIVLALNHKPKVVDDTDGFWRKIRLIPFTRTFDPTTEPDLEAKLMRELPAILAWGIRGCGDWLAEGLKPPATVLAATVDYKVEQDRLADWLDAAVDIADKAQMKAGDGFASYELWAEKEKLGPRERLNRTAWGRLMGGRFEKTRGAGGVIYHGLKLRAGV